MASIPIDLIHSCILPRLSIKTLTRFKSVSKTWQTIISSRVFIHLQHQHAVSSNDNRLFVYKDCDLAGFHIHELDSPLSPSVHCYNPEPVLCDIDILASCEFFLLINFGGILGLVLLNPSTGRYYKIPYPPSRSNSYVSYGMYLDEYNHDYKVVRITQGSYFWGYNEDIMVYSLKTNKWSLIERRLEKWHPRCSIIIGHLLHIVFTRSYTNNAKTRIGCYDILAEKWTTDVPMPQINVRHSVKLTVLDGLLCVTTEHGVWVMKEYGVKNSWFKLMSIASDRVWDWLNLRPVAFREGSQDEVLCTQRRNSKLEYIWYNIRKKKTTTASIEGNFGYICKGSLVDFPGGRNLKLRQPSNGSEY